MRTNITAAIDTESSVPTTIVIRKTAVGFETTPCTPCTIARLDCGQTHQWFRYMLYERREIGYHTDSRNGADSVGKITLTAAADAKPCDPVLATAIACVAIEYSVFVPYCTAPFHISIAK